jgi:hypothetical protein
MINLEINSFQVAKVLDSHLPKYQNQKAQNNILGANPLKIMINKSKI